MAAIVYHFSATGAREVENTFRAIEQRAAAAERAQVRTERAARSTAQTMRSAGGRPRGETERLGERVARDQERKAMILRRRETAQQLADARKVANEKERLDKIGRAQFDRWRAEAHARQVKDATARHKQWMSNLGMLQARADASHRRVWGVAGRIAGGVGGIALGAAGAVAAGAGALITGAARRAYDVEELASKVGVQARQSGEAVVPAATLRREWANAALGAPGATAEGVGSAVQQIVTRTGDLGIARAWTKEIATIIAATDVQGKDLGDVLSTIMQKFDIRDAEDMKQALADLTMQGKKGAVELSDLATYYSEVAAPGQRFAGMKGIRGVKVVGGLMQIARQSTGSSAEAATAVERMFDAMVKSSQEIKTATGVDVFTDKGKTQARDVTTLLPEIIAGAKGDAQKLQGIFDIYGTRAVAPLADKFVQVTKAGGSVQEGMAAVSAMLESATETGAHWGDITDDAAARGQASSNRLSMAWESLSATVGDAVLPSIASMIEAFAQFAQREEVQVALIQIAEGIASAGGLLIDAINKIVDILVALGVIDKNKVAKARRLAAERQAERDLRKVVTPEEEARVRELEKWATAQGATPPQILRMMETENLGPEYAAFVRYRTTKERLSPFTKTLEDQRREQLEGGTDPFITWMERAAGVVAGGIGGGASGAMLGVGRVQPRRPEGAAQIGLGAVAGAAQQAAAAGNAASATEDLAKNAQTAADALGRLGKAGKPNLLGGLFGWAGL